jgi:hypothetical protein
MENFSNLTELSAKAAEHSRSATSEKPTQLECIDEINQRLKKALGIVGLTHGAMTGDGRFGKNDVRDAMWAAYDELEAVRDAFADLTSLLSAS